MAGINDLGAIRERLGWTQAQMAGRLGVSLRTYTEAEASDAPRRVYLLAAQYLASLDPNFDFDPVVPMKNPLDEARAEAAAGMYVAKCALEVALRNAPSKEEGFGRAAWLYDESNAEDRDHVSRRGAFLASEVVQQYGREEDEARKVGRG